MPYPYPIDSTGGLADAGGYYRPQNIFSHGTDLYYLGAPFSNAGTPEVETMHIWKSTDGGVTWAVQDDLFAPQFLRSENLSSYQGMASTLQATLKTGSTTEILIPYCRAKYNGSSYGAMAFVIFDMSTDTWGTPVIDGPVVLGSAWGSDENVRRVAGVYRPATNDYLFVFYARQNGPLLSPPAPIGGLGGVYSDAVVYDVGTSSWGTPFSVVGPEAVSYGDQNWFVRDVVFEPVSGRAHVFIEHWYITDGPPNPYVGYADIYHRTIRANNTLGVLSLAGTGGAFYIYQPITGLGILSNGYLAFPYLRNNPGLPPSAEPWPQTMVVGAEAEVPTWTEYDATADPDNQVTTGPYGVGGWQIIGNGMDIIGYWSNPYGLTNAIQTSTFNLAAKTWGAVSDAYIHPTHNFGDFLTIAPAAVLLVATNRDTAPHNNFAMSFWKFSAPSPGLDIIGGSPFGGPQIFTGGWLAGLPIVGGPPIGGPIVFTGGKLAGLPIVGGPLVGGPVVFTGGKLAGLPIVGHGPFGGPSVFTGGTVAGPIASINFPNGGVCPPRLAKPNGYDCCLFKFADFVRGFGLLDDLRCPLTRPRPDGAMPEQAVEFWENNSIVTPVPGEVLVHEFVVPTGYRGLLYGIVLWYTGTGFVPGSGDIVWRVRVGQAWARDLGNCLYALGTPSGTFQITDFIPLESQQKVRVTVDVPNGSGSIQVGASRVLATLQGWYAPA